MQTAYSFDAETTRKILKGAVHALIVAAALGLLDYVAGQANLIQSNNVFVAMGLAWFSQTGYNAIREWIAGI